MNINWLVRFKNPYFWIGLIGIFLVTLGVSPESLTSWQTVAQMFTDFIKNPFAIGSVIIALIGYVSDPTTKGFGDSPLAMGYKKPN